MMKPSVGWSAIVVGLLAVCAPPGAAPQPAAVSSFRLAGEFLIPAGTPFATVGPSRFGGISGLATLPGGCELLAISDDDDDSRLYRLRVIGTPSGLEVRPLERIPLERAAGAPPVLDPEGIAITRSGTVLISSEGIVVAGTRLPPAILEYTQEGRFVRQLPVPPRFVPTPRGALRTGVRRNGGFESLTLSPDFTRLFTANEVTLVQDGPDDAFAERQRVRLIEYVPEKTSYRPGREFAYDLTPLERPTFAAGFSVNGLVELLAESATELLALERGFVEAGKSRLGLNRVRLYRISLDGATDISSLDSLRGRSDVKPVRKTLVLDFNQLSGLSLRLLNLENFEGLAWVGERKDHLLAVSDDNFNRFQVTAFLLLQPPGTQSRGPICSG